MAQLYGPMQYVPNPAGFTLNSRPSGFQMPTTPAAPGAGATPNFGPSFQDWLRDSGRYKMQYGMPRDNGMLPSGMFGVGGNINAKNRQAYNQFLEGEGMVRPGGGGARERIQGILGGGSAAPALALDSTAAAYANFLNGRG